MFLQNLPLETPPVAVGELRDRSRASTVGTRLQPHIYRLSTARLVPEPPEILSLSASLLQGPPGFRGLGLTTQLTAVLATRPRGQVRVSAGAQLHLR